MGLEDNKDADKEDFTDKKAEVEEVIKPLIDAVKASGSGDVDEDDIDNGRGALRESLFWKGLSRTRDLARVFLVSSPALRFISIRTINLIEKGCRTLDAEIYS